MSQYAFLDRLTACGKTRPYTSQMTRGEPLSPPLEELSVQYCIFALRELHQLQCAVRGPSGQHVYFEPEALSSAPRTPMPWSRGGNMDGLLRVPGRLLSPDMRGALEVQTRLFTASPALPVRFGQACTVPWD